MSSYIKTEPDDEAGIRPLQPIGTRPARAGQNDDDVFAATGTPRTATASARTPVTAGSSKRKTQSTAKKTAEKEKEWNYTYMPANSEQRKKNGRVEGRNLITWNRPRMPEKLLLHIMYECSRHRVDIPWDAVAHRLHPGSTGGAIVQHLNRLRASLIAEGHLVPPICQKPGSRVFVDPHIRGYLRKFPESDDMSTTRPIRFDEPHEDRRFNLPDAWDQTFRPAPVRYEDSTPNTTSVTASPATRGSPAKGKGKGKRTASERATKREASVDPADLDSDGDYSPGTKKPARKRRSTRSTRVTYTEDADDDDFAERDNEGAKKGTKNATRSQTNGGASKESSVTAPQETPQGEYQDGTDGFIEIVDEDLVEVQGGHDPGHNQPQPDQYPDEYDAYNQVDQNGFDFQNEYSGNNTVGGGYAFAEYESGSFHDGHYGGSYDQFEDSLIYNPEEAQSRFNEYNASLAQDNDFGGIQGHDSYGNSFRSNQHHDEGFTDDIPNVNRGPFSGTAGPSSSPFTMREFEDSDVVGSPERAYDLVGSSPDGNRANLHGGSRRISQVRGPVVPNGFVEESQYSDNDERIN